MKDEFIMKVKEMMIGIYHQHINYRIPTRQHAKSKLSFKQFESK